MKKTFIAAIVITALLVGARLYVRSSTVAAPGIAEIQARKGRPVRIAPVKRMDLRETVTLTGQFEPLLRVPAQFDTDGRLVEVLKDVGDPVTAGEVVARLDDREQRMSVAEAEATTAQTRAALDKAIAGPRPQEVQSARAALEGAKASHEVARQELQRVQTLVDRRASTSQQLDQAKGAFETSAARLKQAREGLALLEAGTRAEDLVAARAAMAQATARLAKSRLDLEKRVLHSPIDGVVVARGAEQGEVVKSMPEPRKILDIETVTPIVFVSEVSELFIPLITADTKVEVTVDALPGQTFHGRVHERAPAGSQSTRTFRVEFTVDNPDGRLKPGMFGRSKLVLRQAEHALTVPAYVLRDPDSVVVAEGAPAETLPQPLPSDELGRRAVVVVAAGDRAAGRTVRVDFIAEGRAVIAEGLGDDAKVVVDGFEEIALGTKILGMQGVD